MSTLSSTFTLTGLTLEQAFQQLDQELPAGAYKALPGAVDLTDIDPNWMRKVLNHVFGMCGYGWGYEYDPSNLEYRYETRTNAKGNEYGVYVAVLTHLRFWYTLQEDSGNVTHVCAIHATGASENANIAYALKGAITNALGNAVSNIGFQESVYIGLRSHKDFKTAPTQRDAARAKALRELGFNPPAAAPAPTATIAELPDGDPATFTLTWGKHQGKTLGELWQSKEQGYVRWLAGEGEKGFQPRNPADQIAQRMAQAFLQSAHAA